MQHKHLNQWFVTFFYIYFNRQKFKQMVFTDQIHCVSKIDWRFHRIFIFWKILQSVEWWQMTVDFESFHCTCCSLRIWYNMLRYRYHVFFKLVSLTYRHTDPQNSCCPSTNSTNKVSLDWHQCGFTSLISCWSRCF